MKKLNLFDKFLFFINTLVAILLLTTYVLPFIDPTNNSSVAILSLAYPIFLIINITFIVFWIVKFKVHFLLSTICVLIGISHIHDFYAIEAKEVIKEDDIKLLSFNVRQFNRYDWIKSPNIKQEICDFVNEQQPDIIFFQEYVNNKDLKLNIPKVHEYRTNASGTAIYSKYKIVNKGAINFEQSSNNILFADIKVKNETIRLYNVHLQSFSLETDKENYGNKDKDALVNRFKLVFRQQAHQIKIFKKHIEECPYRTIVAGDFNNTAFSWNYHEMMKGRKDAFVEAGSSLGKSYNYFFPFRIDFILPDNTMEVGKFTTYDVNLSDHYPIMARINLNN